MSADDPNQASKNYHKPLAQEHAELNDPHVRKQMALDRHWEAQRALNEEEDDLYEVGGFLERKSQTFSFHKSRRDRDWNVR